MSIGDPYAELEDLKAYLMGQNIDGVDDDELKDALASVSREIEHVCGRQFNDAESPSARTFGRDRLLSHVDPAFGQARSAWVDDFHTTTGLIVETDDAGDGTFSTVWMSTDYELHPLNGVRDGRPSWPFYELVPVGDRAFPAAARRASLRVTAQWGWEQVPAPVRQATLILAAETHKLRNAPFGVAGFGDMGVVRVRDNPMAHRKLKPYIIDDPMVA